MTESLRPDEPAPPEHDPELEARFAQLVKEVEQGRKTGVAGAGGPSARVGGRASFEEKGREQLRQSSPWSNEPAPADDAASKPGRGTATDRVWPRNLLIAVIVGGLAVGFETYRHHDWTRVPAATAKSLAPSSHVGTAGTATGAATGVATNAAKGAATSATASAVGGAVVGAVSQIPLSQLFPKTVPGPKGASYTLVTAGPLNNCINSDMVGPTLAGMFAQSAGCVGGEGALYKDAAKDQFNITVFTLKDPSDVISIMTELSMSPQDFEVGALQPPTGSGLASLSATSGIVQQFAGSGHYLGVFMAQWSDGRTSDYQSLQQLLNPLASAVSATMGRQS